MGSVKRISAAVALAVCAIFVAGAAADGTQTLSISDAAVTEGGTASFTISLSAGPDPATVTWTTADGSAVDGSDYTADSDTVTVPAGDSVSVAVTTQGDSIHEATETFAVNLSGESGAVIGDGSGVGTITDDDTPPSLSISGPTTVGEGTATAQYSVTPSGASGAPMSVNFSASSGTATAGTDFTLSPGTLNWSAGDSAAKTITVNITNDTLDEDDETFTVNLSGASGATISDGTANTTITDNDNPPTTGAFASLSTAEGNSGTHNVTFVVNLSAASGKNVTVNYSTVNGSATAPSDFVSQVGQNLVIPAGQTSGNIQIAIVGDTLPESNEDFTVNLNSATNASLGADTQATGTITNDDSGVTASINDVTLAEGNSGTTNFVFTVTLSSATPTAGSVTWRTADGSATNGSDYTGQTTNQTLNFAAGDVSKQISIPVSGDTVPEGNETFFVDLVGSSGPITVSSDNRGTGTINNDDSGVTASINDVTLAEGNSGTTNFVFTVTLSSATPTAGSVTWRTADGSATNGSDYTGQTTNQTLSFAPGDVSKQISIPVNGDNIAEGNETFFVDLVGSSGPISVSADNRGVGTINNDDNNVNATINDVTLAEGNSGTTNFVFTVSLSAPAPAPITINYRTADGTATDANNDYDQIASTPLAFATGVQTRTITVAVMGDTVTEPNETFFVDLIGSSGPVTITDNRGTGTINNDDTNVSATINDVTQAEGNSGPTNFIFTVSLSAASTAPITVTYHTEDGTATSGSGDYTAKPNTVLTFAPGVTTQTVTVAANGDVLPEGNETFFVDLVSSTGPVTITDNRGVGTINNDDSNVNASINDVTIAEGNFGTTNFVFTVTLSGPAPAPITLTWRTEDGTATTVNDYAGAGNTPLAFTQGSTTRTISIPVFGDTIAEGNETFFVDLVGSSGPVTITDSRGVGTINNDDAGVAASISDAQATEGNSGTVNMTFTVSLSAPAPAPLTVRYATGDGSALAPEDYTAVSDGLLSFAAGDTTKQFDVVVNGDTIPEGSSENFIVVISPTGATVAKGVGVGTINDDDVPPSSGGGGGGGGTPTPPALTISDTVVTEGLQAIFTVTMLTSTSKTVTVDFGTADGTAKAGSDYTARTGSITFAPGTTQQTLTVGAILDNETENAETFHVSLGNPTNATILKSLATATILANSGGEGPGPDVTPAGVLLPKMVLGPRTPTVVARGYAIMTVTCLKASPIACSGSVILETTTKPKLRLATKKFTVQKGKAAKIHVFLSKRALTLLKKKGTLKARAIVLVKDSKKKNVRVVPGIVTLKATAGLMGKKQAAPKTVTKTTTPTTPTPAAKKPAPKPEEPLPPIKVEVEP